MAKLHILVHNTVHKLDNRVSQTLEKIHTRKSIFCDKHKT